MGDTLSHSSLAGVAAGLAFGFNPLVGSVVACVIAALGVEALRARLRAYQEISTVIILAASIEMCIRDRCERAAGMGWAYSI